MSWRIVYCKVSICSLHLDVLDGHLAVVEVDHQMAIGEVGGDLRADIAREEDIVDIVVEKDIVEVDHLEGSFEADIEEYVEDIVVAVGYTVDIVDY